MADAYERLRAHIAKGLPSSLWINDAKTGGGGPREYIGDRSKRSDELQDAVNALLELAPLMLAEIDRLRAAVKKGGV